MAFLPLAAMAIPAIMSAISGGVSIASAVKQMQGHGLRRHHRNHYKKHPGKGLSPMKIYRGYGLLRPAGGLLHPAGMGLSPMKIYRGYGIGRKKHHAKKRVKKHGGMLTPPGGHMMALLKSLRPALPFPVVLKPATTGFPRPTGTQLVKYTGGRTSPPPYPGGRLRRHGHRRGKGAVADFLGNIPLLGMIAGPIARALGGKLKHHRRRPAKGGRITRRVRRVGGSHGNTHRMSKTIQAILRGGAVVHHRRGHYKRVGVRRVHVPATIVRKGGALVHRRGHYRHTAGRRVHVPATIVRKGGYLPYTFKSRQYLLR